MPILRYENLSHLELSALNRDKTVVLMPLGPLEQHGPHLPLGTDALVAGFLAETLAERLLPKRSEWTFLLFPLFYMGADVLTYTGSIEVKPRLLRELLLQNCKQLSRDGFRTIVAVSAHGGPRHMVVIEEVSTRMKWRHRARMISASARVLSDILQGDWMAKLAARLEKLPQPLTAEEREGLKNDYHGGLLETSIMLAAKPQLVNPMYKTLRPAIIESMWKIRHSSGKKVGDGLGHLGSPALARAEIGQAAIDLMVDEVGPGIERFLDGEKNAEKQFRSKFYFIPIFRTDFTIVVLLLIYPLILLALWYAMAATTLKLLH